MKQNGENYDGEKKDDYSVNLSVFETNEIEPLANDGDAKSSTEVALWKKIPHHVTSVIFRLS